MRRIIINECVYNIHAFYDAADENGYIQCMVKSSGERQKACFVHRFVWECFNGDIPDNKQSYKW